MLACSFLAPLQTSPAEYRYPLRAAIATGVRVTTAFRRAVAGRDESGAAELRAATLALASTQHAEGLAPEQALVSLKRAIQQGSWWPSLVPSLALDRQSQPREFLVYARAFGWFLEGYFGRREADDRGAPWAKP